MNKNTLKPAGILLSLLLSISLSNCENLELDEFTAEDPELHSLVIVPENPLNTDQLLVIETICGNETDAVLDFQGTVIHYKRYVNSLMMMPCCPRTDTTVIGHLDAGDYQMVHRVIDRNHMITDSIVIQDTIYLHVR